MSNKGENGGGISDATPGSEAAWTRASGTAFPGRPPPDSSGVAPPLGVERAVALVERRACESPDAVSVLVDVAETECGWWLLSELVSAESGADSRQSDADATSRSPLVESLARFTRRSAEEVFKTLHTVLLPKLLVTDVVEHVDSVASPPNYATTVELRSDADREFVSAVLFLVAVEAELADETGETSAALRTQIERFSTVVRRIR